jgi:tetratricopeptide (TPR) repeat protein
MTSKITKARELFQQHHLEESMGILHRCIQDNPIDLQALLLRGRINYKMQKWGDAMNDYTSVLEIDPENQEAKSGLQMAQNILGYYTPDMFNP